MTTKNQELIIKKVEELCAKLVQNYENWDEKKGEKIRNGIFKEIKDQILKDLTLWELDLEGNIQPIPGVSVNTMGAGGGFLLFGYEPGTNFIHLWGGDYRWEINRAFVEEIKQTPQDWEIIIEDKRDVPFVEGPVSGSSDHQVVKHKLGRRHKRGYQWYKNAKPGFSDEEWAEIELAVKGEKELPNIPNQPPLKDNKEKPKLTYEGLKKEIKGKVIENLARNNLQISDLSLELWRGAKNWEEELQEMEDEGEIIDFGQKMNQEIERKALAKKEKIRTKSAPENGNATFFLISVMVISLSLVLFSLVYKFRKRNR